MIVYETVRRVYEYDIDEEDFLQYLKKANPNDEDVQNANNLKELINIFGCLDEFCGELDDYLFEKGISEKTEYIKDGSSIYYEDWEDAYEEMEFGIH